jgi:hypothetical protein
MAVLGLCCCAGFSLVEMSRGYSTDAMLRLLIAVVSLVAKHGLQGALASVVVASRLQNTGSIVVVQGLSCSMAYGIFLDQGLNPCLLHCQADSSPRATWEISRLCFLSHAQSPPPCQPLPRDSTEGGAQASCSKSLGSSPWPWLADLQNPHVFISISGINTHTNGNADSYSTEWEIWVSSRAIPLDPDIPTPNPNPQKRGNSFVSQTFRGPFYVLQLGTHSQKQHQVYDCSWGRGRGRELTQQVSWAKFPTEVIHSWKSKWSRSGCSAWQNIEQYEKQPGHLNSELVFGPDLDNYV